MGCIQDEIKKEINTIKTSFYKNILNSKNTKDIWKVIHRILNPKSTTVEGNKNDINKVFNSTATSLTDKKTVKTSDIYCTISSLSENSTTKRFELQTTNYDEVLKIIKSLRNDCSTRYDNIPIFLIKPVAEYHSSPLTFIINNQILTRTFSKNWKVSRICSVPKVNKPEKPADYRPSVLFMLSKVYERIILHQMTLCIEKRQ